MEQFTGRTLNNLRYQGETVSDTSFEDCFFENCSFDAVTFDRCVFRNCRFKRCYFVTPLSRYTDMRFCDFEDCTLIGVDFMSFVNDRFIERPVNSLKRCRLKICTFHRMSFPGYDFSGNEFSECAFTECDLKNVSFAGCELGRTSFSNSDLRGSDFRRADGYLIDIFSGRLNGARFSSPEVIRLLASLDIEIE